MFAQAPKLKIRGGQPPRCAQIESLGRSFVPLAKLCQFVNSPSTLPNFICTEKTQSFRHTLGSKYQYALHTFAADVSFDHGTVYYANVAINGRPNSVLKKPLTYEELHAFYVMNPDLQRSIALFPHFWDELFIVFAPKNGSAFEYRGEVAIDGLNLEVFGFEVKKRAGKRKWDKELDQHLPGIEIDWGKGPSTLAGAKGLIWIDKATSFIRRVVLHYTEIDRGFPIAAFSTSTNYSLTAVAGLGEFLLPSAGEDLSCDGDEHCWRGVYNFSNCRKFAAQSRIVPAH